MGLESVRSEPCSTTKWSLPLVAFINGLLSTLEFFHPNSILYMYDFQKVYRLFRYHQNSCEIGSHLVGPRSTVSLFVLCN